MFTAISSSARQLYLLLRCLGFASKAQIQISEEGIRISVQDPSRVLDGFVFLEKALFNSFQFTQSPNSTATEAADDPIFQISLPGLLETLQIFGIAEGKDRWSPWGNFNGANGPTARGGAATVFDNRTLGVVGFCRLSHNEPGGPLKITIEENNVTTTCELVTYEPESLEDIPFDRDRIEQKIIMRSSWLYDAIVELSSTSPDRLILTISPSTASFSLSANGNLGSATVEFSRDSQLIETFQASKRICNTYKFSLIKSATQAMALASKVSIRSDSQGVLSLQFMIEIENGYISFVDFRFVPLLPEDGDPGTPSSSDSSNN